MRPKRSFALILVALLSVAWVVSSAGVASGDVPLGLPHLPGYQMTFTNDTRYPASGLHILAASGQAIGGAQVLSIDTGCYGPLVTFPPGQGGREMRLDWQRSCIAPGESITLRVLLDCPACPLSVVDSWWTYDALGDPNCDGAKNSIDALVILQVVAGVIPWATCAENSDVNGDGVSDSRDATVILQFAAHVIPTIPPP